MVNYNKCMGGVDLADEILHFYDATRKSYRWFLKVGIHLLQRLCLNAHIVYSMYGGKCSFEEFLLSCARHFLCETGTGRQPLNESVRHVDHHFPSKFSPRGNNVCPTKRCRVCYGLGKIKRTRYFCESCPGSPGLCSTPCFAKFHA